MADIVIVGILVLCLGGILYGYIKRKKSGKAGGCGCGCSGCSSTNCPSIKDE